jgi:type I restriction enzyme, R subunit
MFVDKMLSGLQTVQTLSRLNRSMSGKTDTFVLDFVNRPEDILAAFQPYFQSTYLEGETDPNRLYDLEREILDFHLFTTYELDEFIRIFYHDELPDEKLMPIIERAVDKYAAIEEEAQKDLFKSKVQSYLRLYSYIAQIADFADIGLEKLFIFLKYLNKKLPRRHQTDFGDILSAVDLDSFRVAKTWEGRLELQAADGVMEPLSTGEAAGRGEEEMDWLSEVIKVLNDAYGMYLTDEHKIHLRNAEKRLEQHEDIHLAFAGDNSESNRKFIFEKALDEIMLSYVNDHFEFYKHITQGRQKDAVKEILYQNLKRRIERGEIRLG